MLQSISTPFFTPRENKMEMINFHGYQIEAINFALSRPGAAIFADPGLGKTAIALQCIVYFRLMTGLKTVVIAPLRPMYSTWPAEIERWADFRHLKYQICHGKHKELDPSADLYLVNPEGLEAFVAQKVARKIGFLVVDESSKFKNYKAKRTKLLKQYAKQIPKRMILTGTPAPNGYLDLWSQMHIVDKGTTLGTSFTRFRSAYFSSDDYNQWNWTLKPFARERIEEVTSPYCLRLDGEKLLDLPDFVYRDFHCELSDSEAVAYKRVEKRLLAGLETSEGSLTIAQKDGAYMRCRQLANGFFYPRTLATGDGETIIEGAPGWLELEAEELRRAQAEERKPCYGRTTVDTHTRKLELLRELVDELGGKPVAVVYNFDREREQLQAEFRTDWIMGAGASVERGQEIVKAWNADKIDMLLLHPASAAHGLNLQHGSGRHIIWYSLTDDLEAYLQLNRRIRRQGVKGRVFIYHLITRGAVDEAIANRLGEKAEEQLTLLDALERYRNAHSN